MSVALDVKINVFEFEKMFNANKQAAKEYNEKIVNLTDSQKNSLIKVIEHENLESFIKTGMKNLSMASHGDIVLIENGKEIHREKANYEERKTFIVEKTKNQK
jgi:hypothetical protein